MANLAPMGRPRLGGVLLSHRRAVSAMAAPKGTKRFYEHVDVVRDPDDGLYEVTLDRRRLRTPARRPLRLEWRQLADAIADEWRAQRRTVDSASMHLTGLAMTAVDNPLRADVASLTNTIIDEYLVGDTLLYYSSGPNGDASSQRDADGLRLEQQLHWGRILAWAEHDLRLRCRPSDQLALPPQLDEAGLEDLRRRLRSLGWWPLNGLKYAAEAVNSTLLALSTYYAHTTVEQAVALATLEQRWQRRIWGDVEWAHHLNEVSSVVRLSAGILFAKTTSAPPDATITVKRRESDRAQRRSDTSF